MMSREAIRRPLRQSLLKGLSVSDRAPQLPSRWTAELHTKAIESSQEDSTPPPTQAHTVLDGKKANSSRSYREVLTPVTPRIDIGNALLSGRSLPRSSIPRCTVQQRDRSHANQQKRGYAYRTIQEARARQSSGPFSFKAGALFLVSGGGLIWYFRHEKARMERQRIANQTKGIGKPKVGGPFELIDQDGKPFSSEELRGRYSLVCSSL